MKRFETEVCAYSVESCLNASLAGATRVELCSSPAEGGTTPPVAAVAMAREIEGLELAVMVRPRGGDFVYSDLEFEQMKRDIEFCREAGADCVVLGILLPDGSVDRVRTAELVRLAAPMEVTFHRAFDVAKDWKKALEDIVAAGCHRILTSGCRAKAADAVDTLRLITAAAEGRIEIMAGSGVNPSNAAAIAATGVDALHFSARAVRQSPMQFRRPEVPMSAAGVPEFEIAYSDPVTIRQIVEILKGTVRK